MCRRKIRAAQLASAMDGGEPQMMSKELQAQLDFEEEQQRHEAAMAGEAERERRELEEVMERAAAEEANKEASKPTVMAGCWLRGSSSQMKGGT